MSPFSSRERAELKRLQSLVAELQSQVTNAQAIGASTVKKYNTLALLKAETNPLQVDLFVLLGQAAAGDGLLSGIYIYDATNADTANDASVIQLTNPSTGRCLKIVG